MADRADLKRARADLGEFARLVGRPLTSTQASDLALRKRITVIRGPRQSGKSRSLAVLALHRAFRSPGYRVLIVSAGEEAARRLLAEVRAIATSSPLLAGSVLDETVGLLTLSNGSEIRSVPASLKQIKGWSTDLLLIDEAVMLDDDLIESGAFPTTAARPDARIVLASTPLRTAGTFYRLAQEGMAGSPDVDHRRWTLDNAPWLAASVRALRASMSPERAAAEIDGEFVDLSGDFRLIGSDLIRRAQAASLDGGRGEYTVAVDVSRFGKDRTVAYRRRGPVVRWLFEHRGLDTIETSARLVGVLREELRSPPEACRVIVDDTGVGGGVTDQLRRRATWVHAFIAAERPDQPERFANRRAETAWRLRTAFESGDVDIDPADRELAGQLEAARYRYDDRGRILMGDKALMTTSPDHLDAVSMLFRFWTPPETRAPLSPADEARALLARMDAAHEARWRREQSAEVQLGEHFRDHPLPAGGLDF
jgi:hypothetical protein